MFHRQARQSKVDPRSRPATMLRLDDVSAKTFGKHAQLAAEDPRLNTDGPLRPRGRAFALICVTIVTMASSILLVGLRVWIRGWKFRASKIWGWDDTLAVLALVCRTLT